MSRRRRITLSDIAKRAGVHQTTVSLALRNRPELPAATRERLQRLAQQMGYRPDPALSALRACRRTGSAPAPTYSIAFITSLESEHQWREKEVYREGYEGAARRAAQLGYRLTHFWYDPQTMTPQRATQILRARNIWGVILSGARRDRVPEVDWRHFACVRITRSAPMIPMHLVVNDHLHTVRLAFSRLRALGYNRIGLVMDRGSDDHVENIWSVGFLGEQASLPSGQRVPSLAPHALNRGLFHVWRKRYNPDAILTVPPSLSVLLSWLKDEGVRIPEQLGVATLDYMRANGEVSGVHQHPNVIGAAAVDVVAGLIQRSESGWPEHPTEILIRGVWIDGKTTRPVPPAPATRGPRT